MRVLEVLLKTDYKVGEEEICSLRNSYWLVSQSISVRVVGLPFYISATFVCVLVILQKENVFDCLLPRGMFLFVIKIFYMFIILPSVSVLTKNWF